LKTVSKLCALRVLRGGKSLDFQTVPLNTYQNFISYSKWSARAILNQIGIYVESLFGGDLDTWLIIDETPYYSKLTKM
jgi:hypothetical protein